MAKIALIFVIFALFAVAMAARIPREEPTTPLPFADLLEKLTAQVKDTFSEKNQKEWLDTIQDAAKKGLENLKELSSNLDKSIQTATLPPKTK